MTTLKEAAAVLVASYAKERWLFLTAEVDGEPSTSDAVARAIRAHEAAREGQTPRLDLSRMTVELKWREPGTARSSYVVSGIRRAEVRTVAAGKMPWVETDGC